MPRCGESPVQPARAGRIRTRIRGGMGCRRPWREVTLEIPFGPGVSPGYPPCSEGEIRVKNQFRIENRLAHRHLTHRYQTLTNPIAYRIAGGFFAGCRGPNPVNRGRAGRRADAILRL